MNSFLISYDLKMPNRNYDGLHKAIKGLGFWSHYLESTWIIKTRHDVNQIQRTLNAQIDEDDSLLIIKVTKEFGGWLPTDAWKWINNNVIS